MPQTAQQDSLAQDVQTPKVSVVVPLYYAEDYIDDLLIQLREQPLQEIEIICVIDGSPDGTLDIVKKHAGQDARIQWIYQENAGAGAARNAGLERARGEYLAFLDADDLYDSQFLTKMYDAAVKHDADLVVCQILCIDFLTDEENDEEGFRRRWVPVNRVFAPLDVKNPFTHISVVPSNKLFRKELVDKQDLRFSTTRVSNDNFFSLAMIASSERIIALSDTLVVYCKHASPYSISSNRALHSEDVFECFRDLYAWLVQHALFRRYRDHYIAVWANSVHYNASYARNERFVEHAAHTLANDEPWSSMNDKELLEKARLDTGIIGLKKLLASRQRNSAVRAAKLQRLNNEESAIVDIVRRLNASYGRSLPERSSMIGSAVRCLKRGGVQDSAKRFVEHLRRQ